MSAVIPMIGAIRAVLMQRNFGHHVEGQIALVTFAVVLLTAAPAILRWAVLRRVVPDLPFTWIGASWVWWVVALVLWSAWMKSGVNGERAFDIARAHAAAGGQAIPWSWLQLAFDTAVVALIFDSMPLLILGRLSKRSSLAFLVMTVTGACVAMLLYKLASNPFSGLDYLMMESFDLPVGPTQAQYPLFDLLTRIVPAAGWFGMVQGAVGGYGLTRMFASPDFRRRPVL